MLRYLHLVRFCLGFLCSVPVILGGQSANNENVLLFSGKTLDFTNKLLLANRYDSALQVINPIVDAIKQEKQPESEMGWKLQLIQAQIFQRSNQHLRALNQLIYLKNQFEKREYWELLGKTYLELAALQTKINDPANAKSFLQEVVLLIQEKGLKSLSPLAAVRYGFWHDAYGYPDSVRYYSQLAIDKLPQAEEIKPILISIYTLRGHLEAGEHYLKAISYYQKALQLAKELRAVATESLLYSYITACYLRMDAYGDYAFLYNDSTIQACYQAFELGYENLNLIAYSYHKKGQLFKKTGNMDSAYHYLNRGLSQHIIALEQQQSTQIFEVQAQYNDEQKNLQLARQRLEIKQGRQIRYLLIGLISLAVLVVFILIYSYLSQRKVTRKIKSQATQLKAVDEIKSRFFANVSHELRTPLTLMLGPIQSLQNDKLSQEKKKHLIELANRNGKHLQQMVNEILDLQKLTADKLNLKKEGVQLYGFFQPYLAQFDSLADYKKLTYSYQVDIAKEKVALIDREKCRRILYNLVYNAFKFTPKFGEVKVQIFLKEHQLQFLIRDTGFGISDKDLPHIFDRYFQSPKIDAVDTGGTGIGLAICKEYVELMNGRIEVESELNKGTQFKISIPAETSDAQRPSNNTFSSSFAEKATHHLYPTTETEINLNPVPKAAKRQKILLVEDNSELQIYIRMLLKDKYDLVIAQHGGEAIDILSQSSDFQLIISDLMMPVMDGYQLLAQLKSDDKTLHIPTIMLTARADFGSKLKALRIGVDDYLLKPFHELELRTRIENLLKNQAARKTIPSETNTTKSETLSLSKADQEWLIEFENFVLENISNNLLSVTLLAQSFSMSQSSLLRQLKRLTGLTPQQYLLETKLHMANQLLENRQYNSISEVAHAIGYADVRSFSRLYKKRFGKSPSELE